MATRNRSVPAANKTDPVIRVDAWTNEATGLGIEGRDPSLLSKYKARPRELQRDEIENLYEGDAIFARVIDAPPEHATRRGIEVTGGDAKDKGFGKTVGEALDKLDTMTAFYDAMRWERLDGGAGIVIGADDGQDPLEPLNLQTITSVDFLTPFSRWQVTCAQEKDLNSKSRTYRHPLWYEFLASTETGYKRVHCSRVLRFPGITTTERKRIARQGWGLPIPQRIYDSVRQFGSVFGYGEGMFKSFAEVVLSIQNLRLMLTNPEAPGAIASRLAALNFTQSVYNATVIDKETETYEKRALPFSGVSEAMLRMMDHFSATVEIPLSILFGQAPAGLSTDDQSGKRTFYDSIATKQRRAMFFPLQYLLLLMLSAKNGPTGGQIPKAYGVKFLPLEEPNDQEKANTRLLNATAREKDLAANLISEEEGRTELENDPHVPYVLSEATAPWNQEDDEPEPEDEPSPIPPPAPPPVPGIGREPGRLPARGA
jgi:phage-related protein (TIGR01555 family)